MRRLRTTLERLLLTCLAAVAFTLPQIAPASAGVGYWSSTNCTAYNGWPYARTDIYWNQPYASTPSIAYWLDGYSEANGAHWVYDANGSTGAKWLSYYASGGYQCNWPGAPLTSPVQCPGFLPLPYQAIKFEGGVFVSDYNGHIRNKTWGQGANSDPCHYSNW